MVSAIPEIGSESAEPAHAGNSTSAAVEAGSVSSVARSRSLARNPSLRANASDLRDRIEKGEKKLARFTSMNKGMVGRAIAGFQVSVQQLHVVLVCCPRQRE